MAERPPPLQPLAQGRTIDKVLKALRIRLDKNGHIDWDLWCVDGTSVRASRSAAGASKKAKNQAEDPGDHALGRSRGGWGTKLHLVVDGQGVPLAAAVTAGQDHQSRWFVELMEKVRPPRWTGWPLKVAGDKGYSYTAIRAWLERRVIEQVIPQRSDQAQHQGRRRLDRAAASIASASRNFVTICSGVCLVRFIFESLLDPAGVRWDSHRTGSEFGGQVATSAVLDRTCRPICFAGRG